MDSSAAGLTRIASSAKRATEAISDSSSAMPDSLQTSMDDLIEESRRPDAPDMGPALLGDVVLCPEFAKAQARSAGHGLADELHLLTVHGVLHLLGYDHGDAEQEREMFGLQSRLLAEWQEVRRRAAVRDAQRRADSAVLGAAGLEDG